MDDATVSAMLLNCGPVSGSKLLCYSVVILGPKAVHKGRTKHVWTTSMIAPYAPVIKQLRRTVKDGKFAERLKDLAAVPSDVNRPLAAHRATLLQEPLEEMERLGCALGGEYFPCNAARTSA